MEGLVFGSIEEALAAYALGPFAFRCAVCGQTHRTDSPAMWDRCLVQLAGDWGLDHTRNPVLVDALAVSGVPLRMTRVPVAPAPALLALTREGVRRAVEGAREQWWQGVAEALATMAKRLADWKKGELEWRWTLASRGGILPGWQWWTETQELARRTGSPVMVWWSQEGREGLVMAAGKAMGRLQRVEAQVILGAGRWLMWLLVRSESDASAVAETIVRLLTETQAGSGRVLLPALADRLPGREGNDTVRGTPEGAGYAD